MPFSPAIEALIAAANAEHRDDQLSGLPAVEIDRRNELRCALISRQMDAERAGQAVTPDPRAEMAFPLSGTMH